MVAVAHQTGPSLYITLY